MRASLRARSAAAAFAIVIADGIGARAADLPSDPSAEIGTATVVGPSNVLLANGAKALEEGRVEEALRLTLEGLEAPNTTRDAARGHANACAAYALLERWEEALFQCNASLRLDGTKWRTYNNRAAVFAATGRHDLALRDLEAGLRIAPEASMLKESLRIVRENEKAARDAGPRGRAARLRPILRSL